MSDQPTRSDQLGPGPWQPENRIEQTLQAPSPCAHLLLDVTERYRHTTRVAGSQQSVDVIGRLGCCRPPRDLRIGRHHAQTQACRWRERWVSPEIL